MGLWDIKLLLIGAIPLAVTPAIALSALFLLRRAQRVCAPSLYAAFLLPVGSMVGAWLVQTQGMTPMLVPAGGAAGAAFGLFFPLPNLPSRFVHPISVLVALSFGLLAAGVGKPEHQVLQPFDLANAPALGPAPEQSAVGPDILLISIDTLRADAILRDDVPTPNLDRLRARGLSADFGMAPSGSTLPSHITMLTGEGPMRHGTYSNLGLLETNDDLRSLAEVLQEQGYRTVGTAANELLDRQTNFQAGFEVLVNLQTPLPEDAATRGLVLGARMLTLAVTLPDALGARFVTMLTGMRRKLPRPEEFDGRTFNAERVRDTALHYLDQLDAQDAPYFYFLHFMDPHLPYAAPQEYRGKLSDPEDLPERYRGYPFLSTMAAQHVQTDLRAAHPDVPQAIEYMRDIYHEEVMLVDAAIGTVLERVEATGRPTVILITADHGEHFGEHLLLLHGNSVYEELLRVPFILVAPGVQPGDFAVTPRLEDVPLTLLRAAGFPAERFGEGRDLLAASPVEPGIQYCIGESELAVYRDGYKLILNWNASNPQDCELQSVALYQLESDPQERDNLLRAPAHAAVRQALEIAADNLRADAKVRVLRDFDSGDLHQLAQLGYVFDEDGNRVDDTAPIDDAN